MIRTLIKLHNASYQVQVAFRNVIMQGSGTDREKAIVWLVLAIPTFVLILIFGKDLGRP